MSLHPRWADFVRCARRMRPLVHSKLPSGKGFLSTLAGIMVAGRRGRRNARVHRWVAVWPVRMFFLAEICEHFVKLDWIAAAGKHSDDLLGIAPGQPFRLKLVQFLLDYSDDPDAEFLTELATEASLGIVNPIRRCMPLRSVDEDNNMDQLQLGRGPWKPALGSAAFTRQLMQHELDAGYFTRVLSLHVAAGKWEKLAMARLGVVKSISARFH